MSLLDRGDPSAAPPDLASILFPLVWGDLFCCWSPSITALEHPPSSDSGGRDPRARSSFSSCRACCVAFFGSSGTLGRGPDGGTPSLMLAGSKSLRCPFLAFSAFPPFALECYGMTSSCLLLSRESGNRDPHPGDFACSSFCDGNDRFRSLGFYGSIIILWLPIPGEPSRYTTLAVQDDHLGSTR